MCFRSRIKAVVPAALIAAALGGCSSDIYLDRRDGISLASGDAQAANRVAHMIDPWPPASANRNIAFEGERMQAAAERHRTHRIIRPVSPTTADAQSQPQPPPALTTEEVPISKTQPASAPAAKP